MPGPVTFIHAADLHLGAAFKRLDVPDGPVRDMLRTAVGDALDGVVEACLEHHAAFLVIAGDVYEDRSPSLADRARFQRAMERLSTARVPVYLVRGNHDAADGGALDLDLPASVRVFAADRVERIGIVADEEVVAALYGTSYPTARVARDLARDFTRTGDEPVAIGVLHTNVGSDSQAEDYAPSTLDDLRSAGMDYWALGHIHKPSVLLEGVPGAAYAGSPQGLTPNETGPHGCRLVELSPGACTSTLITCASFAWERLEVDVSTAGSLDDVRSAVHDAMTAARPGSGLGLVARVVLTGTSPAHPRIVAEGPALAELLRDDLSVLPGPVWLDRLEDRTRRPVDAASLAGDAGLPGDIVREATRLADDPEAATAELEATAGQALRSIPGLADEDRLALDPADLLLRARDLALDRLLPEEDR